MANGIEIASYDPKKVSVIMRTPISLMIRDANDVGAVNVAEDECRILKPPDLNRAKEVGSETINIFIPSLNYR